MSYYGLETSAESTESTEINESGNNNESTENNDSAESIDRNESIENSKDYDGKDKSYENVNLDYRDKDKYGNKVEPEDYPAQKRVEVDGYAYRTDDNGKIHMYYDEDSDCYNMIPDNKYESCGYSYRTDSNGSIVHAEGQIHVNEDGRKSLNAKVPGMEEGDERGHIVADCNDGSNQRDNLIPQLSDENRGEYKELEKKLHDLAAEKNDDGSYAHKVEVNIDLKYSDNKDRPDEIVYTYMVDDEEIGEKVFNNRRND